jgi:hypothetical protein
MGSWAHISVPFERNVTRLVDVGKGRTEQGMLGPLDFPRALEVSGSDESYARIRFVYYMVPDEETRVADGKNGTLLIGIHSGRVMEVRVPIPPHVEKGKIHLKIERVERSLEELRKVAIADRQPARRMTHYKMVEDMLEEMAPVIADKLQQMRPSSSRER